MRKKTNLKLSAVRRGAKRRLQPSKSAVHASANYPHFDAGLPDLNLLLPDDDGAYNDLLDAAVEDDTSASLNTQKRPKTEHDEETLRTTFHKTQTDGKVKFLLPTKDKDGLQMRYQQLHDEIPVEPVRTREEPPEVLRFPPFASDPSWKQRVASLSFEIIENPEQNLKCIRELLSGLGEPAGNPVISSAILASLVEVFKDILPGYRIHVAGEVEKEQRMKKETRELQSYEQGLLGLYQKFLQKLEGIVAGLFARGGQTVDGCCGMAVKCLTQLLLTHLEFNFRKNLVSAVVNIATCRVPEYQEMAVSCLASVFRLDKTGDATLDAVEVVSKLAKSGGQRLSLRLLEALAQITISQQLLDDRKKAQTAKPDRKTLSTAERKRRREVAKVEKEMQASQLQENKQVKARLHSQILAALFAIYFRILRLAEERVRRRLLPGVLVGVAKFAHLISVEFMDDLVETLHRIVQEEGCSALEGLLCVRTVLTLVSGQGAALNIDPQRFYAYLLQTLAGLHGTEERAVWVQVVECVRKGFIERKKLISSERAGRCATALVRLALRTPATECLALLLLLRSLLLAHPKLDALLDTEFIQPALVAANDPLAPGPLWELHMLKKHHSLQVRGLVERILGNERAATGKWAKSDPLEVLQGSNDGVFDV